MKIPTVENFLFCLELRLGGIVCGWFGMVGSVLGAIGILLAAIFGRQYISSFFSPVNTTNIAGSGSTIVFIISAIISLIFCGFYFYYSWKLLKGTENVSYTFILIHDLLLIN